MHMFRFVRKAASASCPARHIQQHRRLVLRHLTRNIGNLLRTSSSAAEHEEPYSASKTVAPGLYLVATPIGNLEDITLRALRILKAADTVFAEDCRHSQKLLSHYDITTHLRSYHMHNETSRNGEVVGLLDQGQVVALISDAGCPGISDPGSSAVAAAIDAGHVVTPVPGPAAALAGLIASGLPTEQFMFVGFLAAKSAARRAALESLRTSIRVTMIFYVPPHGLLDVLSDMRDVLGGQRRCCVAREVTKMHEDFQRGSIQRVLAHYADKPARGEITLMVAGSTDAELRAEARGEKGLEERLEELLREGVSIGVASKTVSAEYGVRKKQVYETALKLQSSMHKGPALKGKQSQTNL